MVKKYLINTFSSCYVILKLLPENDRRFAVDDSFISVIGLDAKGYPPHQSLIAVPIFK